MFVPREAISRRSQSVNASLVCIADAMDGDEGGNVLYAVVKVIQEEELGQLCLWQEITDN